MIGKKVSASFLKKRSKKLLFDYDLAGLNFLVPRTSPTTWRGA
jgi:hypothetical protein